MLKYKKYKKQHCNDFQRVHVNRECVIKVCVTIMIQERQYA